MSGSRGCKAVDVVLGARPEDDRLERCTSNDCHQHHVELEWVRADPGRLARYNEQLRLYDVGERLAAQAEQEAQERAAREAAAAALVEQASLL